jgi:hypothetical protein
MSISICVKTTTLIFLDLQLVHHFIDGTCIGSSATIISATTFFGTAGIGNGTGSNASTASSALLQAQAILRPTVCRPVRLGCGMRLFPS